MVGRRAARWMNGPTRWCGRRDLNPHGFLHQILNLARLPIPPRPRVDAAKDASPKALLYKNRDVCGQAHPTLYNPCLRTHAHPESQLKALVPKNTALHGQTLHGAPY